MVPKKVPPLLLPATPHALGSSSVIAASPKRSWLSQHFSWKLLSETSKTETTIKQCYWASQHPILGSICLQLSLKEPMSELLLAVSGRQGVLLQEWTSWGLGCCKSFPFSLNIKNLAFPTILHTTFVGRECDGLLGTTVHSLVGSPFYTTTDTPP